MKIRILGAHNIESRDFGCACLLIDDILAIDASALTSRLTLKAQAKIKDVLLTHRHYDHVKNLPMLGMTFFLLQKNIEIYAMQSVFKDLADHFGDSVLYPYFPAMPPEKPVFNNNVVQSGHEITIGNYKVLPVDVNHAVPCVGYQVTSPEGKKLFYTSDTGPGLAECWKQVSPDLLIFEVTAMNKYRDFCLETGHMTPALLQEELQSFLKLKGYLPKIVTVHAKPTDEKKIAAELAVVARKLGAVIQPGYEDMLLRL
jgi:ribonuclease BN (tRNA processing enzyme)